MSSEYYSPGIETEKLSAGRILVVGSQGGGKTALATKLAARTDRNVRYREEFGGTIETEYLRMEYDGGNLFSLLLPIGGQEKWSGLRTAHGEAAEGIITVLDSTTKGFWPSSLSQAVEVSPVVPYDDYPIAIVVTKEDLNGLIREHLEQVCDVILKGIQFAQDNGGISYYARGFRVVERFARVSSDEIPFSISEQIIVNALEQEFFTQVVPGSASEGTQLLQGFSLVNCRLFSRALASAISQPPENGETRRDPRAILRLLNDMRPTLLELDTAWEEIQEKYPLAGKEPFVSASVSKKEIKDAILSKLLAEEKDIDEFKKQVEAMGPETGWKLQGTVHSSVFYDEGLEQISQLLRTFLDSIQEATPAQKFNLLHPLDEIF
ncbi:MAG: hypothetical protein ACXAB4_09730 [Candidatus Hodarchaeales archaeon]|jgi:GTPase SAR1 family protein